MSARGGLWRGISGVRYRAAQREVALKLLLPRLSPRRPVRNAQILREARLLAKVRHPNVVPVYGVDTHEGRVGFWSDFVRGLTLTSVLSMQGPFGPREGAALVGIDLCKAAGRGACRRGCCIARHQNQQRCAMREEGGRILLMDFGLSLDAQDPHALGGTPAYMAPELFAAGQATVASDIYAMGVLLYCTCSPLNIRWMRRHCRGNCRCTLHQTNKRRSLYEERTDIPDQLVNVIETATRRNPAERFQSAGQMLSALSESLGTSSSHTSVQASMSSAIPAKRIYWWLAAPAVVLLCAAVWFTPLRQSIPFLPSTTVSTGAGAHAAYLQAQDDLDKYYQPHNAGQSDPWISARPSRLDPQFALAYGGLCRAYYIQYRNNETPEILKQCAIGQRTKSAAIWITGSVRRCM